MKTLDALKVGDSLYMPFLDHEVAKFEVWTWVVRTIRGGRIYVVNKNRSTWGKVSTKHGDFGWLENISDWNKKNFSISGGLPDDLFFTKKAAIGSVRVEVRKLKNGYARLAGRMDRLFAVKSLKKAKGK